MLACDVWGRGRRDPARSTAQPLNRAGPPAASLPLIADQMPINQHADHCPTGSREDAAVSCRRLRAHHEAAATPAQGQPVKRPTAPGKRGNVV